MKQHIGNAGIAMVSLFLVTAYGAKIHSDGKVAEMAEMAQMASREAAEATTSEMVALRSPLAGRYLQMNKWGIAASVPATSVDNGWTFERWVKVNVAGNFALHNTYWNRFLVMTDTGLTVSNFLAEDEHAKLPEGAWFENGPGLLGASSVYSQMFKRFLTMTSGGQVGVSDVKDIQEHVVPPNHQRTTNVPEEWTVQTQTFTRPGFSGWPGWPGWLGWPGWPVWPCSNVFRKDGTHRRVVGKRQARFRYVSLISLFFLIQDDNN